MRPYRRPSAGFPFGDALWGWSAEGVYYMAGSDDAEMMVRTTTALCEGRETLNNVVPVTFPPVPVDDEFEQDEPVCP